MAGTHGGKRQDREDLEKFLGSWNLARVRLLNRGAGDKCKQCIASSPASGGGPFEADTRTGAANLWKMPNPRYRVEARAQIALDPDDAVLALRSSRCPKSGAASEAIG